MYPCTYVSMYAVSYQELDCRSSSLLPTYVVLQGDDEQIIQCLGRYLGCEVHVAGTLFLSLCHPELGGTYRTWTYVGDIYIEVCMI